MMTRKEAIKHLRNDWFMSLGGQLCVDEDKKDAFLEAVGMGIKALRPVSREQVERVWRGEWIYDPDTSYMYCEICKHTICQTDYLDGNPPPFCEMCGAPMTDEAVEMVMERLEALYDTSN